MLGQIVQTMKEKTWYKQCRAGDKVEKITWSTIKTAIASPCGHLHFATVSLATVSVQPSVTHFLQPCYFYWQIALIYTDNAKYPYRVPFLLKHHMRQLTNKPIVSQDFFYILED